jgi:outer membrane protein assembly factor BamA
MTPRDTGLLRLLATALSLLLLASCNVTKHIPDNDHLLVKNKFSIDDKKISADDLSGYIQQVPNDKLFSLFRTNIWFYNQGSKGKDSKFKKWLRTKVGSAPVILDTSLISISRKQMKIFLNNKGFFQAVVTDSVSYHKKKAVVHYRVLAGQPYLVRSLKYLVPDTALAAYIFSDTSGCKIKRGSNYDAYLMDDERTRVSNFLLNNGFYHFNPGFVVFRIDSSMNRHQMDVILEVTNPVMPSLSGFGMVEKLPHKQYFINRIFIYPEYDNLKTDTAEYDTLVARYAAPFRNRTSITYYFLSRNKFRLKPRTMAQNVFVEPGKLYNLQDVTRTYAQLNGLQVFKYVNIGFEDVLAPFGSPHPNVLDCEIKLARSSPNAISFSTDATNSAGAFGLSGTVGYQNKNIFTGAQLLKIALNGSGQMQAGGGTSTLLNTLELGLTVSLTFPQFLLPIKQEKLPKEFKPKTILTVGYNFQSQADPKYIRNMFNASFGYNWIQSEHLSHTLNPIELLFVNVNPSAAFTQELDSLNDERLKNQYTSHVVAGLRYSLTFSTQQVSKDKNFLYIRSNFETGGNLLYGINSLFGGNQNSQGAYTIFGSPYAEYVRPDLDLRYYWMFKHTQSLVARFYGGIGIPYWNSDVLPFEKAFMAGGSNDMRGWRMGYLGPGTYYSDSTSSSYSQLGDIQLQGQLEYRFPISGFLKGALFTDVGNIWLLKPSVDLPGGEFNFDTFYKQLGVDAGFGIRLDFDFFIFRLDPAIPLIMPSWPYHGGWYVPELQLKDIIWNFGIGYPF